MWGAEQITDIDWILKRRTKQRKIGVTGGKLRILNTNNTALNTKINQRGVDGGINAKQMKYICWNLIWMWAWKSTKHYAY